MYTVVYQEGLPSAQKAARRALARYATTGVEPGSATVWVGGDVHGGLKVAFRDAVAL